ncbi:MAG: hypothetical protein ACKOBA_00960, partial [Limnohabitans sp.]
MVGGICRSLQEGGEKTVFAIRVAALLARPQRAVFQSGAALHGLPGVLGPTQGHQGIVEYLKPQTKHHPMGNDLREEVQTHQASDRLAHWRAIG